ncbi:serine acetyltransferase [Agarivorans sp. B2Z047]|uniref:Serine acetyltransferase n=1 Tax=Agarivorans albus MKT 106 TaxID=1331007 RepID=R9PSG7_AGAAL|nr:MULTISPECIES: serine acetyltransferase [Agarivorans]MPW29425.1 serine acetyltransferase [Agarivorans sp. B2Z047]GAD04233.1 serine acetyltransferase [Agarivorans albus MKT 106]
MDELKQDYSVYVVEHELEQYSLIKRWLWLLLRSTFIIVLFYRLATHKNPLIKLLSIPFYKVIRIVSGVQIPRAAKIGKGLFLPHFGNIVLNKKAHYGDDLTIYHGVTVGAKGGASSDAGVPVIGNKVRLSTGAVVLGNISIGNNVTVGAGAVVVKDVPENAVAVGNPARILVREAKSANESSDSVDQK